MDAGSRGAPVFHDEVGGTCDDGDDRDDPPILHKQADNHQDADETNQAPHQTPTSECKQR
jgi:hypothetical protein